ncbi:MAG: hypothetical protein ACRD1J_02255 [Terriglobia bacterium]
MEAFGADNPDELKLSRALGEIVWRRWRAMRCLSEWEARSLYGRLGMPGSPRDTPQAAAALTVSLHSVFYKAVGVQQSLLTLNRRLERVGRVFLAQRDGDASDLWFNAPRRPRECEMLMHPESALSNPFLSSRMIRQSLEARPGPLAAAEQWKWKSGVAQSLCISNSAAFPEPTAAEFLKRETLRYALPEDFAGHVARFAAAFGLTPPEPPKPDDGAPSPGWAELERVAELAWKRLPLLAARAAEEERFLRQFLEANRGAPPRELIEAILALVASDGKLFIAAFELQAAFQDGLHALLVARFGPHADFDVFKPSTRHQEEDFLDNLLDAFAADGDEDDDPG